MESESGLIERSENSSEAQPTVSGRLGLTQGRFLLIAALIVGLYGFNLTRDLTEPWYGIHDWNGAFFSQLARNFHRYPWDVHHGMPIVAAGADVPGPEDASIYATHPPAIVWLVAGGFRLFGESEWAARLVPILFSLGTMVLLLWLMAAAYGRRMALLAGLFYAVMPMSAYFGRMVDHEAICLFGMAAAAAGWVMAQRGRSRWGGLTVAVLAIWLGIGVDWSVVVFGGLLTAWSGWRALRRCGRWGDFAFLAVGSGAALVSMLCFLVYAGLGGRWGDLVDIFVSRAGEHEDIKGAGTIEDWFAHVADNLSWLLGILAIVGCLIAMARLWAGRTRRVVDTVEAERSDNATDVAASAAARAGLNLILLAGVIWLVVFWKQFERHSYWMFYIGPAVAAGAANAILTVVDISRRSGARATMVAMLVLAAATVVTELSFLSYAFRQKHQVEPVMIEDWKAIHAMTGPTDRVVVYEDPFRTERRGGYVFRNIVPPHLAWYMDRRMTVVGDLSRLDALSDGHAVFIINSRDADLIRVRIEPVLDRHRWTHLKGKLVIDLSPRGGADGESDRKP